MRILITTDTIGGVWTFTQELAAGLLERENDVRMVSFGRMPSAAQQAQCDLLARRFGWRFGYVWSDVALEWMERNERAFEDGARVLERKASEFAPDVIHSNQFCYGAVDVSVPRVVTAHSDVLSWAKACRTEALPESEWLRNYVAQVQAGFAAADAVVAPTRWMMSAVAESFALPKRREVISNGRGIAAKFDGSRPLCAVTAGRLWDEAKGIRVLEYVESTIPIVVAGESRMGSAQRVESIGAARVIGQLTHAEMLELLERSAIYLCLSVYEPFGLAALEGARCGCAVVARDIESLREVWGDGALYFEDAPSLTDLLKQLARDERMLEDARQRSFERSLCFSRCRMVENYSRLFAQVQTECARAAHAA